jgi:ribose/xylose/arabinose/galactoside ABC-type transport system permease subunit
MLLVFVAAGVVIAGLSIFAFAESRHLNAKSIILAISAISFVGFVAWDYRLNFSSAGFRLFFASWAIVHAAVMAILIHRARFGFWLPALFVEGACGYWISSKFHPDKTRRL